MDASKIGKYLNRAAGFVAGGVGYKTGIFSQVENFSESVGKGKAFLNSLAHTGASANKPLGLAYLASKADKVIKETPGKGAYGYSLTGLGKAVVGVGLGVSAVNSVAQDRVTRTMGQVSPTVQAPPSMVSDYDGVSQKTLNSIDSGADGDLVFALNKLR